MEDEMSGPRNDVAMPPEAVDVQGEGRQSRSGVSMEKAGEALLLTAVTLFFGYIWYESLNWPADAALLPRMAVGLGLPFLLIRWYRVIRGGPEGGSSQVMDTGFRLSGDTREDRKRFIRVMALILLLIVGVWFAGAEVAMPLGVVIYLYFFARVGIVKSAVVGVVLLGMIEGIYNEVLNAPWPEPLLWRLFAGG